MKKKLLLSFAVFATALTVSAQKSSLTAHPRFKSDKDVEVSSQKNDYKSNNVVSNKRSVLITDTVSIANAKWGIAQSDAGTYKLAAYPSQDPSNVGGLDVLFATQRFPMVGNLKLKGFGAYVKGLNPSKSTSVDYQIMTKDTVYSGSIVISGDVFETHFFDFGKSYDVKDTFSIYLSSTADADSVRIVQSGDVSKLGMNSFNGLLGVLSLDKTFAYKGFSKYAIAQDANNKNVDADFQIYPIVDYTFESKVLASKQCLPKADMSVDFDFSANKDLLDNPIFNVNAFFIKYAGQGKAQKRYFATVDYSDLAIKDTIDASAMKFSYTFSNNSTHSVAVTETIKSWGFSKTAAYSSTTNFSLGVCASLDAQQALNGLSIFPNPVANELNVKFNASSSATIELVNVTGQVIATKNANQFANVTFDTAELNAGVYFINIKVAEGTFTQKIIKD